MAEINDIRPSEKDTGGSVALNNNQPPAKLKLRINPVVAIIIGGFAFCLDLIQNGLGLSIIGEFGANEIIGNLSVWFFFPFIIYIFSSAENPVIVYGMGKKDVPKMVLMGVSSLIETLPIATEFWTITISVFGTLSAVYVEDVLNSNPDLINKTNPLVRSVGGFFSGQRPRIKEILSATRQAEGLPVG